MPASLTLASQLARIVEDLADGARGADDIAARLLAAGARGKRGSCEADPVSNYVRARLEAIRPGERFDVDTDDDLVNVEAMPGRRGASVRLPGEVGEFVDGFDDGRWPELVARGRGQAASWRVCVRRRCS